MLVDKSIVFCLIAIAVISVGFTAWTALYKYTNPDYLQEQSSRKKPITRVFVVKLSRLPEVLALNIPGTEYICSPDDYQLLLSLGISFNNICKISTVAKGEVVIIVDKDY